MAIGKAGRFVLEFPDELCDLEGEKIKTEALVYFIWVI